MHREPFVSEGDLPRMRDEETAPVTWSGRGAAGDVLPADMPPADDGRVVLSG